MVEGGGCWVVLNDVEVCLQVFEEVFDVYVIVQGMVYVDCYWYQQLFVLCCEMVEGQFGLVVVYVVGMGEGSEGQLGQCCYVDQVFLFDVVGFVIGEQVVVGLVNLFDVWFGMCGEGCEGGFVWKGQEVEVVVVVQYCCVGVDDVEFVYVVVVGFECLVYGCNVVGGFQCCVVVGQLGCGFVVGCMFVQVGYVYWYCDVEGWLGYVVEMFQCCVVWLGFERNVMVLYGGEWG